VVYRPPGSGKTHTIMAIGHGLVNSGKAASKKAKVMVCAGSNVATEHAMETLLRHAGSGPDLSICAFSSSHSPDEMGDDTTPVARQQLTQGASLDYLDNLAASDKTFGHTMHPELEYHMQRATFIAKFQDDPRHDWYQDAIHFTVLSEGIELQRWQGEELGQVMELFPRFDGLWTTRYFDQVDFVFVTNSSSAHDILIHHANPNVLISEEAAHATLADMVTPAAAHTYAHH
jgi:hypothetical protein